MKSKILTFRDRFDILMEITFSGVAKRLILEMSANKANSLGQSKALLRSVLHAGDLQCYASTKCPPIVCGRIQYQRVTLK